MSSPPVNPPILPSFFTTLWQGITIGTGFLPSALPTALDALGMSDEEVLSEAVSIEGHADNICPSIFGGLTACLTVNEKVKWVKHRFPSGIKLVFVVPEVHISTKAAREILPDNLPFKDAVYNLQRVSLFLETVRTKNYELLSHLLQDKLHQDYRAALVPGMKMALSLRPGNGLIGVFLSGSGPVVCAFTNKNSKRIGNTVRKQQLSRYPLSLFPYYPP